MFFTCEYVADMSKMIQLRNVLEQLHRKLKARAANEGVSLSDYLLEEIRRVADRPTLAELIDRLRHRTKATPKVPPADAVRSERDGRREF
jgi:plasmid stability protein